MLTTAVLIEAYERINQLVHKATEGVDAAGLAYRPEPGANSIAWLVWHLTRIQDDHISAIADVPQVWADRSWVDRTGIDRGSEELGQGDGPDDVAAIRPESADGLLAYHDEVMDRTFRFLSSLTDEDLDRVVDTSYTPPVTAGVRIVSVLSDNIQHAGQARYLCGIVDRIQP